MSRLPTRLKPPPGSHLSPFPQSTNPSSIPNPNANSSTSDRATLLLIRRTLCSHSPSSHQLSDNNSNKGRNSAATPTPASTAIDELLPPLTSSNDLDLQLYAFIAIIIREFINTWYSKITPDPGFVEEVVRIIAHCTRALEQRLRKVDLESLLFDELPELLETHVRGRRGFAVVSFSLLCVALYLVSFYYQFLLNRSYHYVKLLSKQWQKWCQREERHLTDGVLSQFSLKYVCH